MSIHVIQTEDALRRLNAQRRNSTIISFTISLLFILVVALALGIYLLPSTYIEKAGFVTYTAANIETPKPEPTKVPTNIQRKPSAPSSSAVRVIASTSPASTVSIPIPEFNEGIQSVDFGSGDDFGHGWEGMATQGGGGGGGMFGSKDSIPGALKGRLYDFKQNRRGKPITYDPGEYVEIAHSIHRRKFSSAAFSSYFEAPNELNLTNLAVPFSSASIGPEYFGAKETIEPSGWMAAYQGTITAPVSGKYRFRGASDDYLVLFANRRLNLIACYPSTQEPLLDKERWKPNKQEGSTTSPLGSAQLNAGDWLNLKAGEPVDIALGIGERPGGMVGFILEIEMDGETYRTAPDGRKILPLFTTQPFTESEQKEIQGRFPNYEFEWEKVPVFGVR